MKTIIITSLLAVLVGLVACLKQAPDPAFMTDDPAWIEYRDGMIRMSNMIVSDAKSRGTVGILKTGDIDKIHSPEVARELRAWEPKANDLIRAIVQKYGPIDRELIRLDILKAMQPKPTDAPGEVSMSGFGTGCDKEYFACMAKALASAITCHAGCIALTAGFGTPVCVLLCLSIEIADGILCADQFCGANAKNPVVIITKN